MGVVSGRKALALLALALVGLSSTALAQRTLQVQAASAGGAEKRVALVIGNGAYRNAAHLRNPPNDARLMAGTLSGLGFRLVGGGPLIDADKNHMENAIREFGRELRGGAIGLFYYAGHGLQVNGENYLVPVSASVSDQSDVKYELVSAGYVLDEMANANNRLNVVILDACRNNPFGGRGLRSVASGLAQITAPAGTIISYATQPGNTAADGAGRDSPYTVALAKAMREPGLGVFDTFNEVGVRVKEATGGRQQPWLAISPIEGSFQFVPGAATASQAQAPIPPLAAVVPTRNIEQECKDLNFLGYSHLGDDKPVTMQRQAVTELENAVQTCDDGARSTWRFKAHNNLGVAYALLGQWEDARKQFYLAIDLSDGLPGDTQAVPYEGLAYVGAHRNPEYERNAESLASLRKVYELCPTCYPDWVRNAPISPKGPFQIWSMMPDFKLPGDE